MTITAISPGELETTEKTASTRLLDLLAGWAAYVSADEEAQIQDSGLSAETIGTLYQFAGQQSEQWQELSAGEQAEAVSAFVNERIVPLLLRGSPDRTRANTEVA